VLTSGKRPKGEHVQIEGFRAASKKIKRALPFPSLYSLNHAAEERENTILFKLPSLVDSKQIQHHAKKVYANSKLSTSFCVVILDISTYWLLKLL